jgi:hypothetical protein
MIPYSTTSTTDHIFTCDTAIDRDSPDLNVAQYIATHDAKYLPIKAGETPVVWKLRRLSRRGFLAVSGAPEHLQSHVACAYGIDGVAGLLVNDQAVDLKYDRGEAGKRLSEASLDAIFHPSLFNELGAVIINMSLPNPTSGQG